jgi:hypothetical protein|tara:strand:- start:7 stop:552 length:546 start_codon:yes stop_codon:yes gene_type:complete
MAERFLRATVLLLSACSASGFGTVGLAVTRSTASARLAAAPPPLAAAPPRAPVVRCAEEPVESKSMPFFLDIGTKGGVIFWSIVGTVIPFVVYNFLLDTMGYDVVTAGNIVLVGFVGSSIVAWTASYVFRVATKDMTYAKQLRDYENAVIQKRFEELNGDEVDALMDEIYPEKPEGKTKTQ